MFGSRRVGAVVTLLMGCALLTGCGRFPYDPAPEQRRSIKDDAVTERPVRERRAAPAPRRPHVRPKAVSKTAETRVARPAPPPPRVDTPAPAPRPAVAEPATPPPPAPAAQPAQPAPAATVAPSAPVATDRPATAPAPAAPAPRRSVDLLAEGRTLFAEGKVVEARKRFTEASTSAEALLALARTFDTHYLSQLTVTDGAPDMQRALTLYTRALERGAAEAGPDLERVKATLARQKTD